MKGIKIFSSGVIVLFICLVIVLAKGAEPQTAGELNLSDPDLMVSSIRFIPDPKAGGNIDLVKIVVMNRGEAGAGKCILGLSCEVIKCDEGNKCDAVSRSISADIPVPPLRQKETANLEWHPASPVQWIRGKYSVVADIDKYNAVKETNEGNNTYTKLVYLNPSSYKPSSDKK